MRVLVTGSGGFVGRALVPDLAGVDGIEIRAASRSPITHGGPTAWIDSSGYGPDFDWRLPLSGTDTVIHLAGRAHVLRETSALPDQEFLRVNRDATRRIAEQSAHAGVRHFVLVSTIGVHGDASPPDRLLTERDPLAPYDDYTRSKAAGEEAVREAAVGTGMTVTILRPTMVYGRNAPGNFGRLVNLVRSGLPLPFASIRNARSFIALGNLVNAIRCCIMNPAPPGGAFMLADGEDLSTPELIREIAAGAGKAARLVPVHPHLLESMLRLAGKDALAKRLLGSLRVDTSLARSKLGWKPVIDVREALRRAAHEMRN